MKIKLALLLLAFLSSAAISCKKMSPTNIKEENYAYQIPVMGTYNNAPANEQIIIEAKIENGSTLRTYLSPHKKFTFILPGTEGGLSKVTFSTSDSKTIVKTDLEVGKQVSVKFE